MIILCPQDMPEGDGFSESGLAEATPITISDSVVTPPPLPSNFPPSLPGTIPASPEVPEVGDSKIQDVVRRYEQANNIVTENNVLARAGNLENAKVQQTTAMEEYQNARDRLDQGNVLDRLRTNMELNSAGKTLEQANRNMAGAYQQFHAAASPALQSLGVENTNIETQVHAMNPTRLETLADANRQSQISTSETMTQSLRSQDELAKQLKQEADSELGTFVNAQMPDIENNKNALQQDALAKQLNQEANRELERNPIETFVNAQMQNIENNKNALQQYGVEVVVTTSPAVIAFCAESALAHYPKESLPLDKTSDILSSEKRNGTTSIQTNFELSTMEALEQEFASKLAFASQAEKIAKEKGEAFDIESFKKIYEKSMAVIPSDQNQRFEDIFAKSRSYILHAEGVDGSIYLGGYPAGMLQQYLEVTGHQNASDLSSQELTNAYAFALAYNEKGIEPMDVRNFLYGMSMIESRGASNKNVNIQAFKDRFYGITQELPKVTKSMESILHSIPGRSVRSSSLMGQMQQWQSTH